MYFKKYQEAYDLLNDINYLKTDRTQPLRKRFTQIEKFNKRYNKYLNGDTYGNN